MKTKELPLDAENYALKQRLKRARYRNEGLRNALQRISEGHPDGNPALLHDMARAALKEFGQ